MFGWFSKESTQEPVEEVYLEVELSEEERDFILIYREMCFLGKKGEVIQDYIIDAYLRGTINPDNLERMRDEMYKEAYVLGVWVDLSDVKTPVWDLYRDFKALCDDNCAIESNEVLEKGGCYIKRNHCSVSGTNSYELRYKDFNIGSITETPWPLESINQSFPAGMFKGSEGIVIESLLRYVLKSQQDKQKQKHTHELSSQRDALTKAYKGE